jgi:lipoate-protein ligase A
MRRTNAFVMERNRRAAEAACLRRVYVAGWTDLAIGSEGGILRKVSGNSQRRARRSVLCHGTFLVDFDISLIVELLDNPRVAPAYRGGRGHPEFLANLAVSPAVLRECIRKEWGAVSSIPLDLR